MKQQISDLIDKIMEDSNNVEVCQEIQNIITQKQSILSQINWIVEQEYIKSKLRVFNDAKCTMCDFEFCMSTSGFEFNHINPVTGKKTHLHTLCRTCASKLFGKDFIDGNVDSILKNFIDE